MKRNSLFIFGLLLLLCGGHVFAQDDDAIPDSIFVIGTVVDHLTNEPQPYSLLQFIRGADTIAMVRCDEAGDFATRLPVGQCVLSVTLKGRRVYQADLVLYDNVALAIAVITDTFSFRNLRPVEVRAIKHLLGEQGLLIESPNDLRLWDFAYCEWCLCNQPPHYGGADAPAIGTPIVKWGHFYRPAKGSKHDRIWQMLWPDSKSPAPADTTQRK